MDSNKCNLNLPQIYQHNLKIMDDQNTLLTPIFKHQFYQAYSKATTSTNTNLIFSSHLTSFTHQLNLLLHQKSFLNYNFRSSL